MIDRLLSGEIQPGTILGMELSQRSRGRIPLGAWSQPARGGWGDPPAEWARDWVWRTKRDRAQAQQKAA
jgi:hypothetical protein